MALDTDLNDILVFAKVVESRSFTAAGKLLGMPRSTVSRRITQLEKRLGVRLLQRTTRRLQLTDVGASYYELCRSALAAIDEAETLVKEAQATPRGHLRITAPHDIGGDFAPIVASFLCKHREVRIEFELTQRMVDLVGEGFDLALRATSALPDSSLVARRLMHSRGGLYASEQYLERAGVPMSPGQLIDHACIALGPRRQRSWLLSNGSDEVDAQINATMWVNDPGFASQCAAAHAGIALLPMSMEHRLQQLVRVLPDWYPAIEGGVYVVYPSAKHLSATVRAFRDHLVEAYAT
jgi:DNA-binding transcriptional LysR family regulator